MLPAIGIVRPWADPHVVSLHRLDMRPPTQAYASIAEGRAGATSPFRRSLDGRWDFRLFEAPESVPATAITRPVDHRWTKVAVPGNWTLQGVGDLPQYTNVRMPFHGPPPLLPERNPTGVYRRTMTIPKRWLGRQIVLHVGGAESVHAVYVNGEFAGYGTDSRLASEYDITAVRSRGAQRCRDRRDALECPQLHRRSGPVVDGRPAPRGVRRGPSAGPPRVARVRRVARRVERCADDRCDDRRIGPTRTWMDGALPRRDDPWQAGGAAGGRRRPVPLRDAVRVLGSHRHGDLRRARRRAMVGRVTDPVPGRRRAARSRRNDRRGAQPAGRVPDRRGA